MILLAAARSLNPPLRPYLGFQVGLRESAQSWRELLVDIKNRALSTSGSNMTASMGFVAQLS